jgi:enoyl-[acyl-carrier-protein] reductase (NADH)
MPYYGIAKATMDHMARAMALEYIKSGVRVNMVKFVPIVPIPTASLSALASLVRPSLTDWACLWRKSERYNV